jgi:hypothetical protein
MNSPTESVGFSSFHITSIYPSHRRSPDCALGGQCWPHFLRLKQVRDTEHTHTKSPALQITYYELCKLLNLFRTGIAALLLDLYVVFGDTVPSKIIKYAFHPDIKLVIAEEAAE